MLKKAMFKKVMFKKVMFKNATPKNASSKNAMNNSAVIKGSAIKKARNTLVLLALAAVPIITQSQPIEAMARPDCSDGFAKPTCPIWNIKVQVGTSTYFSCETGGEWKCSHPLIEKLF